MAKKEDKAENPQPKSGTAVPLRQKSSRNNAADSVGEQSQTREQLDSCGAATATETMAKHTSNDPEPKISDAAQKAGKALLKSNPDMTVVYMTADGRGFFDRNDAANHARTLNNKAVTPVKR